MKKGDIYRSIYNHYVAKVVKVTRDNVTLENRQGVKETIALENFDLNWRYCSTIYEYRDSIREAFPEFNIFLQGDCVIADNTESRLEFSIADKMLKVQYSDDIKEMLEAEDNILNFLLEDAIEVINMFANLFE